MISQQQIINPIQNRIQRYKQFQKPLTLFNTTKIGQYQFTLPSNYQIKYILGSGTYSVVAGAFDKDTTDIASNTFKKVAIKKMKYMSQNVQIIKKILRQLKFLRLLKHQNIIKVHTIILPPSRKQFNQLYIVFQHMDADLKHFINIGYNQLQQDHYKLFIYQIINGIKYIHSAGVAHRDMKLRNILIDQDCNLKICDFGLSRLVSQTQISEHRLSNYVVTRHYRAPQLIIGQTNYTTAIDMWSLGCVIPQIILNKVMFPGKNTVHQFQLVCQIISQEELNQLQTVLKAKYQKMNGNPKNFQQKEEKQENKGFLKVIRKKKQNPPLLNPLLAALQQKQPQAFDLVKKMLVFNPKERITAEEALQHPFVQKYRDKQLQINCQPIQLLQLQYENHSNLTFEQTKDIVYQQILLYHFPQFRHHYFQKINNKQSVIAHIINNSPTL